MNRDCSSGTPAADAAAGGELIGARVRNHRCQRAATRSSCSPLRSSGGRTRWPSVTCPSYFGAEHLTNVRRWLDESGGNRLRSQSWEHDGFLNSRCSSLPELHYLTSQQVNCWLSRLPCEIASDLRCGDRGDRVAPRPAPPNQLAMARTTGHGPGGRPHNHHCSSSQQHAAEIAFVNTLQPGAARTNGAEELAVPAMNRRASRCLRAMKPTTPPLTWWATVNGWRGLPRHAAVRMTVAAGAGSGSDISRVSWRCWNRVVSRRAA